MNLQSLHAELERIERRRSALEKRIGTRKLKQYSALPASVGLKSIDELVLALVPYGSQSIRSRIGAAIGTARRRGRPGNPLGIRYSAEIKAAVRKALEEGEKTHSEISREFGPTVFSIKDWKKRWGLVKTRGKRKRS